MVRKSQILDTGDADTWNPSAYLGNKFYPGKEEGKSDSAGSLQVSPKFFMQHSALAKIYTCTPAISFNSSEFLRNNLKP